MKWKLLYININLGRERDRERGTERQKEKQREREREKLKAEVQVLEICGTSAHILVQFLITPPVLSVLGIWPHNFGLNMVKNLRKYILGTANFL